MSQRRRYDPITVVIAQGTMGTTVTDQCVLYLPRKSRIVSLHVMDKAGVAADNSNYIQCALKNGATTVAELDTRAAHENGLTAKVAKAANVVAGQELQAAGSSLTLTVTLAGSAVITNGALILTYYPV